MEIDSVWEIPIEQCNTCKTVFRNIQAKDIKYKTSQDSEGNSKDVYYCTCLVCQKDIVLIGGDFFIDRDIPDYWKESIKNKHRVLVNHQW